MAKTNIRTPFFVFNPKSYLFGEGLLELVREADTLAEEFPISIFVTAPFADIAAVSSHSKKYYCNSSAFRRHLSG